jgi:hypothetical protein
VNVWREPSWSGNSVERKSAGLLRLVVAWVPWAGNIAG